MRTLVQEIASCNHDGLDVCFREPGFSQLFLSIIVRGKGKSEVPYSAAQDISRGFAEAPDSYFAGIVFALHSQVNKNIGKAPPR